MGGAQERPERVSELAGRAETGWPERGGMGMSLPGPERDQPGGTPLRKVHRPHDDRRPSLGDQTWLSPQARNRTGGGEKAKGSGNHGWRIQLQEEDGRGRGETSPEIPMAWPQAG